MQVASFWINWISEVQPDILALRSTCAVLPAMAPSSKDKNAEKDKIPVSSGQIQNAQTARDAESKQLGLMLQITSVQQCQDELRTFKNALKFQETEHTWEALDRVREEALLITVFGGRLAESTGGLISCCVCRRSRGSPP